MSELGKRYEVLVPDWKRKLSGPAIGAGVSLFFFLLTPSIIKLAPLVFLLYFGFRVFKLIQLSKASISFYDKGIVIDYPGVGKHEVLRDQVEIFEWDADDIREDGEDSQHYQVVRLQLAYNDKNDQYHDISIAEEFPQGTIQKLQRATQRKPTDKPSGDSEMWDE